MVGTGRWTGCRGSRAEEGPICHHPQSVKDPLTFDQSKSD